VAALTLVAEGVAKVDERVTPFSAAQVLGSSPYVVVSIIAQMCRDDYTHVRAAEWVNEAEGSVGAGPGGLATGLTEGWVVTEAVLAVGLLAT
jgi:hypothetical protein